MDSKELRGLMEAYSKVYVSQEETIIDEGKSSRPRYSGPERVGLGPEGSERRTEKRSAHAEYRRGHTEGPGTVTKNPKKLRKQKAMGELGGSGKAEVEEGYLDIFDVVLEFLQVEGYAETLEEAEWMMANLIDEEAIDIILDEGKMPLDKERRSRIGRQIGRRTASAEHDYEGSKTGFMPKGIRDQLRKSAAKKVGEVRKMMGALKSAQKNESYEEVEYVNEAQAARENPEKYEREQAKKSAPVRGERTPMPPRGDKRREDFEKWYAKQMGR